MSRVPEFSLLDHAARALGMSREIDDQGRVRKSGRMQTFTGRTVFVLDPRADEIYIDDIGIGIARECRYGNQPREFYGVGEHSILVSIYAEKLARERGWSPECVLLAARFGLLHDATEAYLKDIHKSLKKSRIMRGYRRAEDRLERAILEHFDLWPTRSIRALVKEVDDRIVFDEVEALMLDPSMYTARRTREPLGATINAMPWQHAATVWFRRYVELWPSGHNAETNHRIVSEYESAWRFKTLAGAAQVTA